MSEIPRLWTHRRVLSFGAGTQSVAALVAQARGLLDRPYDEFVWSDVGADSEEPEVHEYMRDVVIPYAHRHDIKIVRVAKQRYGVEDTVLQSVMRNNRSIPIPARMSNGAPSNRSCTYDYKIKVVDDYCKRRGWTHVTTGLCFSVDEYRRTLNKPRHWTAASARNVNKRLFKRYDFPLIDDLLMDRQASINLVMAAGLPKPPRSACWFCPFKARADWLHDKNHRPEVIQRAAILEAVLNKKRSSIGKDAVYLHPSTRGKMNRLLDAISDQMSLFDETCESGYCGL